MVRSVEPVSTTMISSTQSLALSMAVARRSSSSLTIMHRLIVGRALDLVGPGVWVCLVWLMYTTNGEYVENKGP